MPENTPRRYGAWSLHGSLDVDCRSRPRSRRHRRARAVWMIAAAGQRYWRHEIERNVRKGTISAQTIKNMEGNEKSGGLQTNDEKTEHWKTMFADVIKND